MAESRQHTELVMNMANYVKQQYSNYRIIIDVIDFPGDETPPKINGAIPDLYATFNKDSVKNLIENKEYIIGEAKTSNDLRTQRSEKQISSFLLYLKEKKISSFILSVPYESGDEAKSRLNLWCKEFNPSLNDCIVFDQCDSWKLKDSSWHLI